MHQFMLFLQCKWWASRFCKFEYLKQKFALILEVGVHIIFEAKVHIIFEFRLALVS
jgi:hypothetical protein